MRIHEREWVFYNEYDDFKPGRVLRDYSETIVERGFVWFAVLLFFISRDLHRGFGDLCFLRK